MIKRTGAYTIAFESQPVIAGWGSVVGKKEAEGPLKNYFDKIIYDSYDGCDTFEQAESMFQGEALEKALERSKTHANEVDCVFAGDLLNQCIGSSFGLMKFGIPYLGQYGACSTMAQSLIMAASAVESGGAKVSACVTSSHFASAERQYRFPLEYGGVRTPTAQWTVTGAGSCILKSLKKGICVARATVGRIVDLGVSDANNMGAAMAPAVIDTLTRYFTQTGTSPADYDLIATGDLGVEGHGIVSELMKNEGYDMGENYNDCGMLIYDIEKQDMHAGASGCGCSAVVLAASLLERIKCGELNDILFIGTGALMNPMSVQQGQAIPGIAHLVRIKK